MNQEKIDLLGKDRKLFCEKMDKIFHCRKPDNEECYFCFFNAATEVQAYCNMTGKTMAKGLKHWVESSVPQKIKEKVVRGVFGRNYEGDNGGTK